MLYILSEIVIILNRGVLWLRKREVFIGFIGKWETRQCIISQPLLNSATQFVLCHSTSLHVFLFLLLLFHHTPSVFFFVFFYCMTLLTPTFICLWVKKDKRFFSLPVVLSLTHFSLRPVSCVFSPISGILRSPPSMWVTLMCAAGLSCRAGSSPSAIWGCCVLVCLDYEFCVCLFLCVPCL